MGGEGTHPDPGAPPADGAYGSDDSTRGSPGPYGYHPTAPYLSGGSAGPYGSQHSTIDADAASFPLPSADPYGKIQSMNRPAAYPPPGGDPYGHHGAYPPGANPPPGAYPPQAAHLPPGAAYPLPGPNYGAAYPPEHHGYAHGYNANAVAAGIAGIGIAGAGAAHGGQHAGYPPSGYPPAGYPSQGSGHGAPAPAQHYYGASGDAVPYTSDGYHVGHEGSSHCHSDEKEKHKKDKKDKDGKEKKDKKDKDGKERKDKKDKDKEGKEKKYKDKEHKEKKDKDKEGKDKKDKKDKDKDGKKDKDKKKDKDGIGTLLSGW